MAFCKTNLVLKLLIAIVLSTTLAACGANHHSSYRHQPLPGNDASITSIDAKQRVILVGPKQPILNPHNADPKANPDAQPAKSVNNIQKFCAEPSPDVFSVVAQSLSAGGTFGQTADPKVIEASLKAAFSSAEQGSSIPRTQTVNMLRELMYRTCERYLGGGITDLELPLQAIRDQRLMVSILAIEQLTGVVTPKVTQISASSSSSAGSPADDSPTGGNDEPAPNDNDETEVEGVLVKAETKTQGSVTDGKNPTPPSDVARVVGAVNKIVDWNFKQDEFLFLCLKVLAPNANKNIPDPIDVIQGTCLSYVQSGIQLQETYNRELMAKAQANFSKAVSSNFEEFWSRVEGNNGNVDSSKSKTILSNIKDKKILNCFEGKVTKDAHRACFEKLLPGYQRILSGAANHAK